MALSNMLETTVCSARHLFAHPSTCFIFVDPLPRVVKLYLCRLAAILAMATLWATVSYYTQSFTTVFIVFLGAAVGGVHLFFSQKTRNYHLLSSLTFLVVGSALCYILAGLAFFSSKMGLSYWQVLSANLAPESWPMLVNNYIRSVRGEDFPYYLGALAVVCSFCLCHQSRMRLAKRFKLDMRVYFGSTRQLMLAGDCVNLSASGLFLNTEVPLEHGEQLLLRFRLPGQEAEICCQARVAWANRKGEAQKQPLPPGAGLQFLGLTGGHTKSLLQYMQQNLLEPVS